MIKLKILLAVSMVSMSVASHRDLPFLAQIGPDLIDAVV